MKITNMFKDWTLFEKLWIVIAVATITTLGFLWDDTLIGFISSIAGILCVIMAAKGKIATFYFGAIQASTYAYIAYTYQLYGEAMLNAFFFLPFQVIGWIVWFKNRKNKTEATRGEEVYAKRLTLKQWAILTPIIIVVVVGYAFLLESIGAQQVRIDSVAVVLSVFAQILMTLRFAEQWLLWIVINVLTITMWLLVLVQSGGNDWTVFAMWCAFLANSIYGWLNWRKLAKNQTQEKTNILEEVKG